MIKLKAFLSDKQVPLAYGASLLLAALALFPISQLLTTLLDITVWRHDSVYYFWSYDHKLVGEGRWINYLLFSTLKEIPAHASIVLQLVCLSLFCWIAAQRVTKEKLYSFSVAILCICVFPLYSQLLWPVITLPGFLILLLAAPASHYLERYLTDYWASYLFYSIFGILLFASISYLIFLLPLLHIHYLTDRSAASNKHSLHTLCLKILVPWITGFIIGFLFANIFVYFATGNNTFIELAEWRKPNPVTGMESFVANVISSVNLLKRDLTAFFTEAGWLGFAIIVSVVLYKLVTRKNYLYLLIPVLVLSGLYASVIPGGIFISYRTTIPLWIGMIFLALLVPRLSYAERPIALMCCLCLVFAFSQQSALNLDWYRYSTDIYKSSIEEIVSQSERTYRGIALLDEGYDTIFAQKRFKQKMGFENVYGLEHIKYGYRVRPSIIEAGFNSFHSCNKLLDRTKCWNCAVQDKKGLCMNAFSKFERGEDIQTLGFLSYTTTPTNFLVIKIDPAYIKDDT